MTTLLHPAAAAPGAPAAAAVHHSEPLGAAGVCSFHLAETPSGESLRLMRAFLHQLGRRLAVQQEQLGAWHAKVRRCCCLLLLLLLLQRGCASAAGPGCAAECCAAAAPAEVLSAQRRCRAAAGSSN